VSGSRPPRAAALGLTAAVLIAAAAGGMLFYRLSARGRSTLQPGPPPAAMPPLTDAAASAASSGARIPEQLPEVLLPAPDGVARRLTDWHGRPLLVNFWATWCEPCRREIPLLRRLRGEHHDSGLEVVGIAIDSLDAVRDYMKGHGIDYPVLVGEKGGLDAARAFGMEPVLPFSVFADRMGRVVTLKIGELHQDEAEFILDRVHDVDSGALELTGARRAISDEIGRLSAARVRHSAGQTD